MLIITLRTDKPEAELGLYEDDKKIDEILWHAHRDLSVTIHKKIESLLIQHNKNLNNLQGVACFKGPGSFTGLRIGLSVANALAYGLKIPIIGSSGAGWQKEGIKKLLVGQTDTMVLPEYGQEPHITKQKK